MAKTFKSYKEESRTDWGTHLEQSEKPNREQLTLGAVLRIADSLEKIEQPYTKLLDTVEYLRTSNNSRMARINKLERKVASYKGVITKMKKKGK